jgi:hypothetical protein
VTAFPLDQIEELYAGAPTDPATCSLFPGHMALPPFVGSSVRVRALGHEDADADLSVAVMLDLGSNRDVARLELYGNPLLPPAEEGGRPVHNLGLPRALALYALEDEHDEIDLHGRVEPGVFDSRRLLGTREPGWATLDLRALHGWTPIHLPATFGRYLVLVFRDLPLVYPDDSTEPRVGLDIQRIVVWPFLEDVDHRPHVEFSPVASRQRHYPGSSAYWERVGVDPPDPDDNPSTGYDGGNDALLLPSALAGIGAWSPEVGEVRLYASDLVAIDAPGTMQMEADPRILLTLETTTDEVPTIEGVRLDFRPPPTHKGYYGPKSSWPPDYVMRVHVTNDREAAFSPDPAHPAWRPVCGPILVRASQSGIGKLLFVEPVRARWVRLTATPRAPEGVDSGGLARLQLSRVDILRCRDFVLAPEPLEDVRVDHVLLRFRGKQLLEDYAYLDGENGVGLTLEARAEGGSFEELVSVRNLVELLESTSHRIYANQRRIDKPVQRLREVTDARSRSTSEGTSRQESDTTTDVRPEYGNRQVTRAGSVTTYSDRPKDNLGDAPFAGLPDETLDGLRTTRSFEVDFEDIQPPQLDPNLDPAAVFEDLFNWSNELTSQGLPVSVGAGYNQGFNIGASAGVQVGGSAGGSFNVGTQLGGGITRSEVEGSQGSVVQSEAQTIEAHSRQKTTADVETEGRQRTRSHDERDTVREDLSAEVRRAGVEVRYGGRDEDIILCVLPVGRMLRGSPWGTGYQGELVPAEDVVRLRVDHLPPDVRLDVEFRGRLIPRERER